MVRADAKKQQFEEYFTSVWGERWTALRFAMSMPHHKVAVWNRFTRVPIDVMEPGGMSLIELKSGLRVFQPADTNMPVPQSPRDEINTMAFYITDLAQVLVIQGLGLEPYHKVLDLCAGNGSMSVIAAQYLTQGGELTANEQNSEKNKRVHRLLRDFLPMNSIQSKMQQRDPERWYQQDGFQRILVNAPCTSERHVLSQPNGAATWTMNSVEAAAEKQMIIVLRGLESLQVDGILMYATTSVSPIENDDVVAKVLIRTRCQVEVVAKPLSVGETTAGGGWIVLPDTCNGMGPAYTCCFRKLANKREIVPTSSDDDSDDEEEEEEEGEEEEDEEEEADE
jgi:16S rRNA C967 or C1407 C5-methylase (RsmB/RsmF family)